MSLILFFFCGSGVWTQLSWVLCSGSHKAAIKIFQSTLSFRDLNGEESPSESVQIVGRISLAASVWHRPQMLAGYRLGDDHPWFLETAHSSGHVCFSSTAASLVEPGKEVCSSSLLGSWSLTWRSTVVGVIARYLPHSHRPAYPEGEGMNARGVNRGMNTGGGVVESLLWIFLPQTRCESQGDK